MKKRLQDRLPFLVLSIFLTVGSGCNFWVNDFKGRQLPGQETVYEPTRITYSLLIEATILTHEMGHLLEDASLQKKESNPIVRMQIPSEEAPRNRTQHQPT